jgi:hypothetical protein
LANVVIDNPTKTTTVYANSFTNVSSNKLSKIIFNNTANFSDLSPEWQNIATNFFTISPAPIITIDGIIYSVSTGATVLGFTSDIQSNVTIPNSVDLYGNEHLVTNIGNNAFKDCSSLISITITDNVTSIGESAFYNCNLLESLNIPNNLTSIPGRMCENCFALSSIVIPTSVTNIGTSAFQSCTSLTSVIIPDSVTSTNGDLFRDCTSLVSVTFNGKCPVPVRCFLSCTSLTSGTISSDVTSIQESAFQSCTSLETITIPSSVISIGNNAFKECSNLDSIVIPNSVTSIGNLAFGICNSLITVTIENPANVTTIYTDSFTNVSSNPLSSIAFNNTAGYNSLSSTWQTIALYYATQTYSSPPTLSDFPNINTTRLPDSPAFTFTLTDPSSNSTGAFSFTSSNTEIASTAGNVVSVYRDGSCNITATQAASDKYTSGSISCILFVSNVCFPAGTLIKTDQGVIVIEKINPDIHTINNKRIVGITQTISTRDFLVCFEKHALGNNVPSQKTLMTPFHEIFYNGKMRPAIEFIEISENVYKTKYRGEILYNVLMEKHDKMLVHNMMCETLNPENPIAKMYNIVKKCSPEEQKRLAKEYNEFTIKNNNFSQKQLKYLNKCM